MTLLFKCYLHVFSEVDYIVVKTLVWLYPLIRTPYESCTSAPCRACSLKRGPLQQGREDWVFRNSRILGFVPILEGHHPWLAQRASQAEAAIRVVAWPCFHLSEDAVIKRAVFPQEMSWRFGRLRAGLGSTTHGQAGQGLLLPHRWRLVPAG